MKYDPALDGLRALSVAAVLLLHGYATLFPGGWAGVEIFFVLSGFLITNILVREQEGTGRINIVRFYVRRFLRLAPALLALLAFCLLVSPFQNKPLNWGEFAAAGTYMMNWYRALGLGRDDMLGHTWSLAIEEQFYLLWPAFLIFAPRRMRLPTTLALLIAVIVWRAVLAANGAPAYRAEGFDTHCDALLMGCAVALVWRENTPRLPPAFAAGALLLLGAIVLTLHEGPLMVALGIPAVGVLGGVLLLCARQGGAFRTVLVARPLVFTGRISYGIYLWHYPMVVLAGRHLPHWLMWVPLALGYGAAVLSYRIIEAPALRLKDRFEPRGVAPPQVAATAPGE